MSIVVRFRASYVVPNLRLNPESQYDLRNIGRDATALLLAEHEDAGKKEALLEISCNWSLNKSRHQMLKHLEEWRLPPESTPDPKDSKINADFTFAPESWSVLHYLPPTLQELYHEVRASFNSKAERMLRLLRWRYSKLVNLDMHSRPGLFWESIEKGRWFRYPSYLPKPGPMVVQGGMSYHTFVEQFILDAMATDVDEPMGHRLVNNAWLLCRRDARAAIVLAVAALEVSVKDIISTNLPNAKWLVSNLPTPPIERILVEFFPTLFGDAKSGEVERLFSKETVTTLRKAVQLRNQIAHTGAAADFKKAEDTCLFIRELLFKFDYLTGYEWAQNLAGTAGFLMPPETSP